MEESARLGDGELDVLQLAVDEGDGSVELVVLDDLPAAIRQSAAPATT
jgi:hypothetical protein